MHCERRFLKLEILASEDFDGKARLKVLEQTHTDSDFAFVPKDELDSDQEYGPEQTRDRFDASNGVTLLSCDYPLWVADDKRLYVQGYDSDCDNVVVEVALEDVAAIAKAVHEYNQAHSMDEAVEESSDAKMLQVVQFVLQ